MNKAPDNPRKALGKGLSALLPTRPPVAATPTPTPVREPDAAAIRVPIQSIAPNPLQPRRLFQNDRLQELAQSIRANGIIQPLVVRKVDGQLQLVAGERRWRAAQLAGLKEVPVVVQEIPDDRLLEITLIENIQREDLNPVETAQAFDRMIKELHLTSEEVGQRTRQGPHHHRQPDPPPQPAGRSAATGGGEASLRRPRSLPAHTSHRRTAARSQPRSPSRRAGRCARWSASRKK